MDKVVCEMTRGIPLLARIALPALILLSPSIVLSLAAPLAAQETGDSASVPPDWIVGQVIDARNGEPIVGARVSAVGTDWASITNATGRFALRDLDPGIWNVQVENLGYTARAVQARVPTDGRVLVIEIEPDPIVLEGLEVVTRRFETRRRAVGVAVREFGTDDLAVSGDRSVAEMLQMRFGLMPARCTDGGNGCVWLRGRSERPEVYIDEAPILEGWEVLDLFRPYEFHMLEVFQSGRHIRAYTHAFMERASRTRYLPIPIGE